MSVLIKDMNMPTTCTMCWLNTLCGAWNTETAKYKGFNKRLDDCPLAELIRCKDCKYFDLNHVENVSGIPLIVAHEICMFWGEGCRTKSDGYCAFGERKEE